MVGAAGSRVRAARLESARTVIDLARRHDAAFVLLAGDTFEHNGVSRKLVEDVARILGEAGRPVYVLPGNHDPLETGSVWEHSSWEQWPHVRVLRQAEPVPAPGATLYPCPLRERWSGEDPTAWIPSGGEGVRIGIAHGTVKGVPETGRSHPIALEQPVDYMALGHWHSTAIYGRAAYSGTHEPTAFGERESGNALLVEIDGPGAPPRVRKLPTARLQWVVREGSLRETLAAVESEHDPGSTLVDCRPSGFLAACDRDLVDRLEMLLRRRFLFARLDRSRLLPEPEDDGWIEELPAGYLRETARRLRARQDAAGARALLELYGLL